MGLFDHDPDRLDNRDPEALARFARWTWRTLRRWHRAEFFGLDRLPGGPALIVGNHNGGTMTVDSWLLMAAVFRSSGLDDMPYALGHDMVLGPPIPGAWLCGLGGVRASPDNARRVLEAGHKLLVYPGGDVEAMRPYRERDRIRFDGRKGYVRLALQSRVPIVPVVAAGAHATFLVLHSLPGLSRAIGADRWGRMKVWPATLSIPWGLTFGPAPPYLPLPTKIVCEALEPIELDPTGPEASEDEDYVAACAARVEDAMQEALTRLARYRRGGGDPRPQA